MATVEEVLNDMSTADVIGSAANIEYLIDNELRIITVPQNGVVLGVEGDKDVNVVHFKMPRMYRGLDLGDGFNIRVNYANAKAELGYFAVVHPDVTEDSISFEWLLGSHALMYVGEIKFAVSLIKSSVDGRIEKKFNTTLGKAQCLTGLDVDVSVPEEDIYDLLTQIKQDVMADIQPSLDGAKADAAAAKQSATQAAESAATASTGAENVRLGVETVKDAVKIAEQTSAHVDEVKTAVEASAAAASGDAAKAEAAKTAAVTAQGKAEAAKTSAEQFKMAAEQAKNDATAQAQAAAQSAEAATQAKTEASTAKTSAAESAKQAKASQDASAASAQTASTKAGEASASAQTAKGHSDTASAKAAEAKTSADAAKVSETNAKAAENAATNIVENAKVVSDNVLKGEETATLINVTDAWPSKLRGMKIYGQSNQLTTKGINLLPNCEAKETKDFPWGLYPTSPLTFQTPLPTGQYTVSVECGKSVNFYYKEPGNTGTSSSSYSTVSITAKDGNRMKATFTADKPIGALYFYYASEGKHSIAKARIEADTKAFSYEPYTGGKPSPSPEYPQEITNLSKAELVITGRNLVEQSTTSTNALNRFSSCLFVEADLMPSTNYVLSFNDVVGNGYYINEALFSNFHAFTTKSGRNVVKLSTRAEISKVNTGQYAELGWIILKNDKNQDKAPAFADVQIELGDTETAYEPHQSKSAVIDLKGNELCSVTEHRDELVIDSEGNVSLIKRVFSAHIDGLEPMSLLVTSTFQYFSYTPKTVRPIDGSRAICSNRFGEIGREPWNFYVAGGSNAALFFTFPIETFANDGELNEWLKSNPIDVNYLGAEPQTIPLGKIDMPALPESTSNVWNNGNIPANVYIQYLKDVNIAYADLEAQIKQLTASVAANTLEIATK